MTTPVRWVIDVLNKTVKDVSVMTGVSGDLVDLYIDEHFINHDADYEYTQGEGMPQSFARDLALGLRIHRGALECDLDNRLKYPVFRNTVPAIDGNFGTCHIRLPGKPGDYGPTMFRVPQSSASDFIMPQVGEPVSFLDDRLDVHVLQLEQMVRFRTEEGFETGSKDSNDECRESPNDDLNPEAVLGAFEILMHLGAEAFFKTETIRAFSGIMSETYVSAIQKAFEGWNMEHLLERLLMVRVHLASGEQLNYHLKQPYSPMLDDFYRFCRSGRLPPFFILNEDNWVECIPTSEIVMVSIPWVLIARYGAHIDAECGEHEADESFPGSEGDGRIAEIVDEDENDDDTIVLMGDLVTRKAH